MRRKPVSPSRCRPSVLVPSESARLVLAPWGWGGGEREGRPWLDTDFRSDRTYLRWRWPFNNEHTSLIKRENYCATAHSAIFKQVGSRIVKRQEDYMEYNLRKNGSKNKYILRTERIIPLPLRREHKENNKNTDKKSRIQCWKDVEWNTGIKKT